MYTHVNYVVCCAGLDITHTEGTCRTDVDTAYTAYPVVVFLATFVTSLNVRFTRSSVDYCKRQFVIRRMQ